MAARTDTQKNRLLDAFLTRLARTPFDRIELSDVAEEAGVTLSDLRTHYAGRLDLLEAFNRRIDLEMLARDDPAMADEPGRDRLFDTIMHRLEALTPHKEAVRSLDRSVRRDPALALAVAPGVLRSMAFVLASARVPTAGPAERLRVHGMALAWARIVRVWLGDQDPGLARTLVAVDRELGRAETADRMVGRIADAVSRLRGRRRPVHEGEETMAAGEGI